MLGNIFSPTTLAKRAKAPFDVAALATGKALSDGAVKIDASDKAVLVREKDSQNPLGWADRMVSFWFKLENPDADQVIWKNDHFEFGYDDTLEDLYLKYLHSTNIEHTDQVTVSGAVTGWHLITFWVPSGGGTEAVYWRIDNQSVEISAVQGVPQDSLEEMFFGGSSGDDATNVSLDSFFMFNPAAGVLIGDSRAELLNWLWNDGDGRTPNDLTAEQVAAWNPVSAYSFDESDPEGSPRVFDLIGSSHLELEYGAGSPEDGIIRVEGIAAGRADFRNENGDAISSINDRSPVPLYPLSQSTLGNQPIAFEDVDGYKWMRFDGVNDIFQRAWIPEWSISTNWTFAVVVKPLVDFNRILGNRSPDGNDRVSLAFNVERFRFSLNDGTSDFAIRTIIKPAETVALLVYTWNQTTLNGWFNGESITSSAGPASTNLTDNTFKIAPAGSCLIGHESLYIIPRVLTEGERLRLQNRLAEQFGITLS